MIIPPKPANVTWTDDQWKAIHALGRDILVAAAAGSGKTAVLVNRIIQKVIDEENPMNVDEMLVATFTNASAAEMRARIAVALEEEIKKNPGSHHLRKQLSLLNNASISTLHSFCLNVVKKYYYLIDIDPGFRIADDTEMLLLMDEALETVLEAEYGKPDNESFFKVVDIFTNDRNDQELQQLILNLYTFSRSHPNPEIWLRQFIDFYDVKEGQTVDDLPFIGPLKFDIELQLQEAKRNFEEAYNMTKLPGGPDKRANNFLNDIEIVNQLLQAKEESFEVLYHQFQNISFTRLSACKGDEYIEELLEQSKELREKGKKIIQKLKDEIFSRKPETYLKDLQEMKDPVSVLVDLVLKFFNEMDRLKTEKGLVDFSDMEHYALKILGRFDNETGEIVPTEAARQYRDQFKEVFIDEYQDTNMVQETILQLVKKPTEERGNLFMVGDVKQSIYRFRLAEPNLFLQKYLRFNSEGNGAGLRIDLSQNFRSRKEVLDGTNFIFKQIMGVKVGEIDYDEASELKYSDTYPEDEFPVEVTIIHKESGASDKSNSEEFDSTDDEQQEEFSKEELEQSQLESRYVAKKIRELIDSGQKIYDSKSKSYRKITYKDIVILLRSFVWAPQFMEELKSFGVPVYANISTGYFQAAEVSTILSLLKVIDNPFQDIPLAATLRSPIIGLNEEEMAKIRIHMKKGSYYEAAKHFLNEPVSSEFEEQIQYKLKTFFDLLKRWRSISKVSGVSDLIWTIYRDTKFFDFVGGLPGGKQRQANLRALYDRARQYESTSFRGLFRFLRFIDRMQDRGEDLGVARSLSEQEDVVRIMTIHSSKGLEFPVVFLAGIGREFNFMDIKKPYLFDKEFGFATNYVNPEKQIRYNSLIHMSIVKKKLLEVVSEEMRVLYVALTRAKEKLYLIGSTKKIDKLLADWQKHLNQDGWLLPDFDRMQSKRYLDWIGPALIRHENSRTLRLTTPSELVNSEVFNHPSKWVIQIIRDTDIASMTLDEDEIEENLLEYVKNGEKVPIQSELKEKVEKNLTWEYPYILSTHHRSKQSVSEIKRQKEIRDSESGLDLMRKFSKPLFDRPKFLQEKKLTPAEKGTAMHLVMQHVNFDFKLTKESIHQLLQGMILRELLTSEEVESINVDDILSFYDSEIGERLLKAKWVKREVPFSYSLSSKEIYSDWNGGSETVFIQGIIDCLFMEEDGLVLVDYKTDQITGRFSNFESALPILKDRYEVQIQLYKQAIEAIINQPIKDAYLFFFDGSHVIKMN